MCLHSLVCFIDDKYICDLRKHWPQDQEERALLVCVKALGLRKYTVYDINIQYYIMSSQRCPVKQKTIPSVPVALV
jgi:hypothetical protein